MPEDTTHAIPASGCASGVGHGWRLSAGGQERGAEAAKEAAPAGLKAIKRAGQSADDAGFRQVQGHAKPGKPSGAGLLQGTASAASATMPAKGIRRPPHKQPWAMSKHRQGAGRATLEQDTSRRLSRGSNPLHRAGSSVGHSYGGEEAREAAFGPEAQAQARVGSQAWPAVRSAERRRPRVRTGACGGRWRCERRLPRR